MLGACAANEAPRMDVAATSCGGGAAEMRRLELLFGLTLRDGRKVSPPEWEAFVDAEVTPRFPDGLTVLKGYGQWRTKSGNIARVNTNVLVIWYWPGAESEGKISAIRTAYKSQFGQESVMRVEGSSCVSF
jgi:hypothetical protein